MSRKRKHVLFPCQVVQRVSFSSNSCVEFKGSLRIVWRSQVWEEGLSGEGAFQLKLDWHTVPSVTDACNPYWNEEYPCLGDFTYFSELYRNFVIAKVITSLGWNWGAHLDRATVVHLQICHGSLDVDCCRHSFVDRVFDCRYIGDWSTPQSAVLLDEVDRSNL